MSICSFHIKTNIVIPRVMWGEVILLVEKYFLKIEF